MKKNLFFAFFFSLTLILGCAKSDSGSGNATPVVDDQQQKRSPAQTQDENNQYQDEIINAQVLLFNGIGISTSDWQSLASILQSMGLTYKLVNSSALNAMPLTDLIKFKLIIIPGGNSHLIVNNLSLATKIKVRKSVRDYGVSFLGICAGAFASVGTDTWSNTTAYYGFAVAQGAFLPHWYPNGNTSLVTSIQKIRFANGTSRYMVWWDGPSTTEWTKGVIARYPDGKPAISQTWTGKGFVIESGIHPEAPKSWQYDTGVDPDGTDFDIAIQLIRSALNRTPLPAY